jgi:hypothetical protein
VAPNLTTPDNIWFDDCTKACTKAFKQWMAQTVNIDRKIRSLKDQEIDACMRHVVDEWISAQSRRAAEQKPYAKDVIGLW